MNRNVYILILCLLSYFAAGQEYLTGIGMNPLLFEAAKKKEGGLFKTGSTVEAVSMPFYDDFSSLHPFPDSKLWTDNKAFINTGFAVDPPDYGVATLDVLDSLGFVYKNIGLFPKAADHLTSRLIRLDSIYNSELQTWQKTGPSDSLYLSFYYQPQGNGVPPSEDDSLVLQFGYSIDVFDYFDTTIVFISNYIGPNDTVFPGDTLHLDCDTKYLLAQDTLYFEDQVAAPCDSVFRQETVWTNIWSTSGYELEDFVDLYGRTFERVMIAVKDSIWFRPDFRMRFVNYASVAAISSWRSNTDQWNIDNVYLNAGRSINDTAVKKAGFADRAPSFLDGYSKVPYAQYSQDPIRYMNDSVELKISNLDSVAHTCSYKYQILSGDDIIYQYDGGSADVFPYFTTGYMNYPPFSKPPVKTYFPTDPLSVADSVGFTTRHFLTENATGTLGDTISFTQAFQNYFAYDDGTAEAGYGLSPSGAMLAYRFNLVRPDTLRAISMYFNNVQDSANKRLFHFAIWNDNNGIPGTLIHTEENQLPIFLDGMNSFHTYHFDNDSIVFNGTVYIGWIQTTNHNLNVGYDRNTNSQDRIFYNVEGTWIKTSFEGSLMIRPVFGKRLMAKNPAPSSAKLKNLKIWPNPPANHDAVYIELPDEFNHIEMAGQLETSVYDMTGRRIRMEKYSHELNIATLKAGIYIITVRDTENGRIFSQKLIIERRH
ncbi:MAG: T9SS type A sorting domain-containing protein [Bacteroidales bacterium]|nr:T9SS type A sorting domain-containing protein [Bacteroidales bacterium]